MSATTTTTSKKLYPKRLEGIHCPKGSALAEVWHQAFLLSSSSSSPSSNTSSAKAKALRVLRDAGDPNHNVVVDDRDLVLPIPVLEAIQVVALQQEDEDCLVTLSSLNEALQQTVSLAFTPPPTKSAQEEVEDARFHKRMERLRLKNEETKYGRLTDNLQDHKQEDDITAKSMTYAASVGLNMIVAPLSFGCFMYFFAGGIMDYIFPVAEDAPKRVGGTDIKKVIVGVISGVLMLFIEMILFVIRTHEFEQHQRKKQKKKGGSVQPFGVYSKDMPTDYYSWGKRPKTGAGDRREEPQQKPSTEGTAKDPQSKKKE